MAVEVPDIVEWAESEFGFYIPGTEQPIVLAQHQRDILRHVFTPDERGRFPYETVLLSAPKKSGKTTLAALITLWFALFIEPPNEIHICANDLEQSIARVFKVVGSAIKLNPYLRSNAIVRKASIIVDNGTTIEALSSDYSGAAGSNHGLTVWDELWGYRSENARRLWDELTPVPTRANSLRLIVSYAGFTGESTLLEELIERGLSGEPV